MHFIKHPVDVSTNEKNASKAPVITAPKILVATNSIANNITDANIVNKIAVINTDKIGHIQSRVPEPFVMVRARRSIAR